jgi:glutamate decarboxylase
MIRQGVSRDMAGLLVKDFERAIAHFDTHPVVVPLTEHDIAGHNHN